MRFPFVHGDLPPAYLVSEKGNFLSEKFAFCLFHFELFFPQNGEDLVDVFAVFLFGATVD